MGQTSGGRAALAGRPVARLQGTARPIPRAGCGPPPIRGASPHPAAFSGPLYAPPTRRPAETTCARARTAGRHSLPPPTRGSVETGLQHRGAEPAENVVTSSSSTLSDNATSHGEDVLASCLALLAKESPDLARVIEVWPALPDAICRAVLALIGTANGPW